MSDQLSMLDTMFLELEEADESAHMHIGAGLVFDPRDGGSIPTIDELRAMMGPRLGLMPRFAQRLSDPHTDRLRWLTWEPVEDVDLELHVRHATLPEPGGDAELREWLGDFWSHRLDRRLPLWEVTLLDGLEDGRWALATKTHHCLVDGVGSLDIGKLLLDEDPDAPPRPEAPLPREPDEANGGHFWLSPGLVVRGARAGVNAALHPRASLDRIRAATELVMRDEVIGAPNSSINKQLTGTRHFLTVDLALDDVRAVREELGGTINDIVLTICAGGLRRLLLARGEKPPAGLRAQIPVNIRSEDRAHALGNELTSLFVELPVDEPDARERLRRTIRRAEELKSGSQRKGGKTIIDLADMGPPLAGELIARSMFGGSRMFNLTITNVPGPRERLYAFGAPMTEVLPLVPLFAGHTIGIAIVSYAGRMVFGINADRAGAPDAAVLADGIRESFADLRAAAPR